MYDYDNRVVITLDAGGTNLVFGAMQANKFIVDPITLPSNADNLDKCLATMVEGFRQIMARVPEKPVAISFAFPGPADYPNGIIGGYLPNFPSFRDGVALGPFLEAKFGIPVFINNDGDLFAFGEALGGALPEVNARLEALGSSKRYKNLLGYTFGTGFGIGMVIDNRLNRGDNSCVETFCLRHKKMPDIIVEDGVAVRAIKRVYGELTGNPDHGLEPKDICEIADGTREGDAEAAKKAFAELGEVAGEQILQRRHGYGRDARRRTDRHRRRHHRSPALHHAEPAARTARKDSPAEWQRAQPRPDEGLRPGQRRGVRRLRQG